MTMNPLGASARRHDPDEFGIEINYAPHSDTPSRIFRTMTTLIEAFQEIDGFLVKSIHATIRPTTLLEDIEAGSLRVWLRDVLETIDDEALKSGEWKKILGAYLVMAKRIMVDWTAGKTGVESAAELDGLQRSILDEARKTGVLTIPMYVPIPTSEIARSVELLSDAVKPLREGDSMQYLSAGAPPVAFNVSFQVVPEALTDLLVKESLVNDATMILMVKRPDFLGDSKWEFRYGTAALHAKMQDATWVSQFRTAKVAIMPGDALRAIVRSTARYGYDGDVVDLQYEVTKVIDVIHAIRPIQDDLPSGRE